MNDRVTAWLDELAALRRAVLVTKAGQSLSLAEGIEAMTKLAFAAHAGDGKLMFVGNGGSAAIASHMAIDYWKNGGLRATAFNDASLLTCLANDYGYEHVFGKTIEMLGQPGDVLVAISSSGRSPNILRAVDAARSRRCGVITLSGFAADNPLRAAGDLNFYVPAQTYGHVELTHLAICHCVLDLATGAAGAPGTAS